VEIDLNKVKKDDGNQMEVLVISSRDALYVQSVAGYDWRRCLWRDFQA